MQTTTCPDRNQLTAFLRGDLPLNELEAIAEHLDTCPACESSLIEVEAARDPFVSQLMASNDDGDSFEQELELQRVIARMTADSNGFLLEETPPSPEGEIPKKIGTYKIVEKLGRGGMGTVYKAIHAELEKTVALKVLTPSAATDSNVVSRFRREIKAAGRLSHPNLVQAYDAGEADGVQYLVMELVDGLDVSRIARRLKQLNINDACEIVRQAAVGISNAHECGVIHRDLKPSNLILSPNGTVKVLDLGIARLINQPATDGLSQMGLVMGTVDYMAPEQAGSGHPVDVRTDVYGLGATLFRLLAGRVPHSDPSLDSALKKIAALSQREVPAVNTLREEVPTELASLVTSMLSKNPVDRPASALEVAHRLNSFCHGNNLPYLLKRATQEESTDIEWDQSAVSTAHEVVAETDVYSPPKFLPNRRTLGFAVAAVGLLTVAILAVTSNRSSEHNSESTNDTTQANADNKAVLVREPTIPAQAETPPESKRESPRTVEPAEVVETDDIAAEEPAHESSVVPIAILPFKDRSNGLDLGNKLADVVYSQLTTQPDLYLLEREELKSVLDEQELSLSGAVTPSEAIQVGRITGAKLFVTGSVSQIDRTLFIVAKIIGTETSRTVGASVTGDSADELGPLALELAKQIEARIKSHGKLLLPTVVTRKDRIGALKKQLGDAKRPKLWIRVSEEHIGHQTIDPAVQTELILIAKAAGFTVIDEKGGDKKQADVIIEGEAFSELATRRGGLISVRARAEVKVVDRATSEVIAIDRETTIHVDLAEQTAGKSALQTAGREIAFRILPALMKRSSL